MLFYATRPAVAGLFWVWTKGADSARAGPFDVIVMTDSSSADEYVDKFADAVKLIQSRDQSRYKLITRHIRMIVVTDQPSPLDAEYHQFARAVVVRGDVLRKLDTPSIAAMLVHEATHGRLGSLGIRHTAGAQRRIERLCLRNEIWFLEKIPGAESLTQAKRERMPAKRA